MWKIGSFELGKEKETYLASFHERPKSYKEKKFWFLPRNLTSNLRIPRSDALPLSRGDSMVRKAITKFIGTHQKKRETSFSKFVYKWNPKRKKKIL